MIVNGLRRVFRPVRKTISQRHVGRVFPLTTLRLSHHTCHFRLKHHTSDGAQSQEAAAEEEELSEEERLEALRLKARLPNPSTVVPWFALCLIIHFDPTSPLHFPEASRIYPHFECARLGRP